MKVKTSPFDAADYLKTEQDYALYLDLALTDALNEDNPRILYKALGTVARARGMTAVAREAGISREGMYRSLSEDGNPSADSLLKIFRALGVQLCIKPADEYTVAAN